MTPDIATWALRSADGLDLADPDDRALYRTRIGWRTARTRVDAIVGWCAQLGATPASNDRHTVTRTFADATIKIRA